MMCSCDWLRLAEEHRRDLAVLGWPPRNTLSVVSYRGQP